MSEEKMSLEDFKEWKAAMDAYHERWPNRKERYSSIEIDPMFVLFLDGWRASHDHKREAA